VISTIIGMMSDDDKSDFLSFTFSYVRTLCSVETLSSEWQRHSEHQSLVSVNSCHDSQVSMHFWKEKNDFLFM